MKKRITISTVSKYFSKGSILLILALFSATLFAQTKPSADSINFNSVVDNITTNPTTGFQNNDTIIGNPIDGSAKLYLSTAYAGKIKSIIYHVYHLADMHYNQPVTVAVQNGIVELPNLRSNPYEIQQIILTDGTKLLIKSGSHFSVYSANIVDAPTWGILSDFTKNMEGDHITLFKTTYSKAVAAYKALRPANQSKPTLETTSCGSNIWTTTSGWFDGTDYCYSLHNSCGDTYTVKCIAHNTNDPNVGVDYYVISGTMGGCNAVLQQAGGIGQQLASTCTPPPACITPTVTLTKVDPTCASVTGSITASLSFGHPVALPSGFVAIIDGGTPIPFFTRTYTFNNISAGTHTFKLQYTTALPTLCFTAPITITLADAPTSVAPSLTKVDPSCTIPTGSITISNGNGGTSFSFDNGAYGATGTFTNLDPGSTHSITGKNAAGCISPAASITIGSSAALPIATATLVTTGPVCVGTAVSFNVAVTNYIKATDEYTYLFDYSMDNGTTWTNWYTSTTGYLWTGAAFAPTAPGIWKFRARISNACGSTTATTSAITVQAPPTPIITFVTPTTTCLGSIVGFTVTVTNPATATDQYTYKLEYSADNGATWTNWTTGNTGYQWSGIIMGPNAAGLWKYRVTVSNACGSNVVISNAITVQSSTTPSLTKTDPTCTTGTASISVSPVDPTLTYSLDGGAYSSTTTWNSLAAGSTHSVTAQSAGGCPSAAATITVGTAPTKLLGTITGNQTPCFTDSLVLTAGGGSAYSWTINSLAGASAGNTATIKVKPLVVTTYFVKITNGSCSDTQNVVVNAARPALILATVITICKGNTQDVIADGGGIAGYTYRWIAPAAVAGITTPKLTAMMPLVTTAYTVERTTPAGCKDTATDTIIVYQQPVLGTVVKTDAACNGTNNGTITINATSPSNLVIEYSINGTTWQTSNVYSNLAPGTYSILARNQNGVCQAITGATITIGRLSGPVSGIAAPPRGCAQETVEFDVTPTVPNATYAWTVTNNSGGPIPPYITGSSNGTSYIVSFPPAVPDQTVGRGETITLAVSLNGCTSNYVSQINITGPVFSHGGPDTTVCLGGQLFLGLPAAAAGPSGASFSWGPADMIQGTTTASQFTTVPLFADQEYDLTVTDALNGCTHTSKVFVAISTALNPRAKAGASRMVLAGATSNLGSPITSVSDAISKVGYTWSTVTGVNGNANLYSPTDNQPIFLMPTPATPYRYALKVRRQFNGSSNTPGLVCYAYDSVNITTLAAPVPDLVPKLIFNPSVVIGIQTVEGMIQLSEIGNVVTNGGTIQLLLDKNSNLGSFNYNPTQTKNTAGLAVQNSLFTVDATSSPDYYIFTSVAPILLKNSTRRIVYTVVPLGTKAKLPISLYLRHGDGGETNFANDTYLGSLNLQ